MWDLLFGKPKKRYYKPKKKLDKINKKPERVVKNPVEKVKISQEYKNLATFKPKNKAIQSELANIDIIYDKKAEKSITKLTKTVDILWFDILINKLKQELSNCLKSAFFAENKSSNVLKSWQMKNNQSAFLSKILYFTNQFLIKQNTPGINSYLILNLDDNMLMFVLKLDKYQFVLLLDSTKINIGYLISIIKPIIEENYYESQKLKI